MAGKLYIILVIVSCCLSLVAGCGETCSCQNLTLCHCSYNVSLRDNSSLYEETKCCDSDSEWVRKYTNTTFLEIGVRNEYSCNNSNMIFRFEDLKTFSLDLKNNSIKKIELKIQPGILRSIDLSYNKLQYIVKGIFNNFTNLKKLVLSQNEIVDVLEGSFNGLSKLESLDLAENKLTSLANVFIPLKNLQHLNLSRNNIEFIHENYFNNWLLQHLDVSHNNLKKVAPGALQLLPNLARLLLTDNPHLGITQLDTQLLVGTGRRLQQIDASRTGLYQVPEAFTHSVRFLSLVGNRISAVSCGDLDSYPLLQSLDFSDNKIVSVEDDSLGRLEMLLFLNFNKNYLTATPKSLPDELKYLSVSGNLIKNLTVTDFKNLPNLKILLLQDNHISFIEDHVFDELRSLEMLDLSNNPIKILSTSTFDGPLSLRDLRLCYLNVSVPAQDGSFPVSAPETIQMLHLQSSPGLAKQLLADSAALAAFSHLQYLDLRMNNLSNIRNDLLFYLGQLKTLRLHGNGINCSAELWIKDWLNSNITDKNGETCYYSSLKTKEEESKYNCTFSETFTISESLPPVNLYSTEMINKLLRYYGFLSNKTENEKVKKQKFNHSLNRTELIDESINLDENEIRQSSPTDNKWQLSDYYNDTAPVKARETSKILDMNRLQNIQSSLDHRFLDLEPNLSSNTSNKSRNIYDFTQLHKKHPSGKRLNTPLNITRKYKSKLQRSKNWPLKENNFTNGENVSQKVEFSPYKASPSYAKYIGTIAVFSLIVMCIIIWVSFRLRHRRRRLPAGEETEDQIEVSNISGGVLW